MKTGIRAGNSHKTQYKAYKVAGRWKKNKVAKLTRRALKNENDNSALIALENSGKQYGRQKPGNKGWFHPQEYRLIKETKSEDEEKAAIARDKLAKLYKVYYDTRPSAIQDNPIPTPNPTILDQLYNIGLINAKRYTNAKSRMGSLRKRRAFSNR